MSLTKMVCGDNTLGKTDLLISNVNGLIDFSNFTDALKLSVNTSAMSVMESASVITLGTTNPLASGQAFSISNDSLISGNRSFASPNISIFGGGYFQLFGTSGGQEQVVTSNNVTSRTNPTYIPSTIRLSFVMTGSTFSVKVRPLAGYGTQLMIKVDGKFLNLTPTTLTDDNTIQYASVDFGSSRTRRIDILGYKLMFGGVFVSLQDAIVAAERNGPKLFMIGDSFSEGSGNELGGSLAFPVYMQEFLGIDDLTLSSVGGTGLIRGDSGKANYQFRFQRDIVDLLPSDEVSIVWISLSINDNPYTTTEVSSALNALIDMLDSSGKDFRLFVSSPTIADGAGLMPEILIQHNEVLKALVIGRGHQFIDEITMPLGRLPSVSTTITASCAANAKTITTTNNLIAGCNYRFDDGTLFFVRSTNTSTRTATVDNIRNAQASGANITLVGSTYLTGGGKVNFPDGWGNCDFAVSSDSLHPTNFGHKLKGINCANLLVQSIRGV